MNKPTLAMPARSSPRGAEAERRPVGRVSPENPPKGAKPIGPIIYEIQKGADVWPGRK